MTTSELVPAPRLYEIDGIRGWAALVVLMSHLACDTFGAVRSEFQSPILRTLLDGNLAVAVFFVLSGDALSLCYTRLNGPGIEPKMIVKRYFRLAGPIVFSCIVVYLLMKLGLTYNKSAAPIVHAGDWLGGFLSFSPSFLHAMKTGLIGVFAGGFSDLSYNPFMWPMAPELAGSLLVFSLGIVYPKLKRSTLVLAVCSLYLGILGSWYALFLVGILLGRLRAAGVFAKLQALRHNGILTAASMAAVLILDTMKKTKFGDPQMLVASCAVWTIYSSNALTFLMRTRLSRFVGKISFPVYFMQFSVIVSWTSWAIVAGESTPSNIWLSPYAIIASSAAIVIGLASAVEVAEAWYLRKIDAWVKSILIGVSR
jgi:peptidoglycan/LPS O-acetylase OafA/YrhL